MEYFAAAGSFNDDRAFGFRHAAFAFNANGECFDLGDGLIGFELDAGDSRRVIERPFRWGTLTSAGRYFDTGSARSETPKVGVEALHRRGVQPFREQLTRWDGQNLGDVEATYD